MVWIFQMVKWMIANDHANDVTSKIRQLNMSGFERFLTETVIQNNNLDLDLKDNATKNFVMCCINFHECKKSHRCYYIKINNDNNDNNNNNNNHNIFI